MGCHGKRTVEYTEQWMITMWMIRRAKIQNGTGDMLAADSSISNGFTYSNKNNSLTICK